MVARKHRFLSSISFLQGVVIFQTSNLANDMTMSHINQHAISGGFFRPTLISTGPYDGIH
jgi:hypothetical protein